MAGNEGGMAEESERAPTEVAADARRVLARMASEKVGKAGATSVVDLTVDSVLELVGLGTVADPSYPRRLTFEGARWRLDLDVTHLGERRSMEGALRSGGAGQVLTVRQAGATTRIVLDDQGRFRIEDLLPGPVSVTWEASDQGQIETSWVSI
ncbi:MAG: hypothetical protein HYR89_09240 [Actinobacteria bacterium]|nr:hypothetical protein [Actinomycetota bacterium]